MKTVYLQFTVGQGPRECAYAVKRLLEIAETEARAESMVFTVTELERSEGPLPEALLSATVRVEGANVEGFANKWVGTIGWVGISPYRPAHKRRNWFIGVASVAPPMSRVDLAGRISMQSMRASGPGGQNVNKTNSAVRATHAETGLMVTSRESRSQSQNRRLALRKLAEKIEDRNASAGADQALKKWAGHRTLVRGNPIRIFHGSDFKEK